MKGFISVILPLLFWHISCRGQHSEKIARFDNTEAEFSYGTFTLNNEKTSQALLFFDRPSQRLYVKQNEDTSRYSASEVISFRINGTGDQQARSYVSWKYRREWPSYERKTFFRIVGDFDRCAVVTSDRKPVITDLSPEDRTTFIARVTQGIQYHLIIPGGKIVPYERNSIDYYLRIILEDNYKEVMQYAVENGLRPTRLDDLLSILQYATQLSY